MRNLRLLQILGTLVWGTLLTSCNRPYQGDPVFSSSLSNLEIGDFTPHSVTDSPQWSRLNLSIRPLNSTLTEIKRTFEKTPGNSIKDNTVKIPYGRYTIKLTYVDSQGNTIYESCLEEQTKNHAIDVPRYAIQIKICRSKSMDPIGTTDPAGRSFVDRHGSLMVQGNKIVDKNKQAIQLRGMSLFWSQWSTDFWNRELVKTLNKDWKATVIRAAMGVEEGGYLNNPQSEKDKVKLIVDQAVAEGIYVIIDWHDHNAHAHPEKAIEFFTEMAGLYARTPHVIFEIFNEPREQTWGQVKSYSESVIRAIRAKGANNLIIVGSPEWSQRVDLAANNPIADSNVAYTLHFYSYSHRQDLRNKAEYALNKGIALFVTEFGVCDAFGTGPVDLTETDKWMAFMDKHQISWANWSMFDKQETASALRVGASRTGPWSSRDLTVSGDYIKRKIAEGEH